MASEFKGAKFRHLPWLVILGMCVILSPLAVKTFDRAFASLKGDVGYFQLDNEEGALLHQSLELAAGRSVYRPLDSPPYTVGTYPPLYLWISGLFTDSDMPGFQAGRIINLLAVLLIGVSLVVGCYHRTTLGLAGVLALLLWTTTFELYVWIPYYRVDMAAIAFSIAAVVIASLPGRSRWIPVTSAILCVAGVYCKHTAILAPAIIAIYWTITQRDRAKVFLPLCLGLGGAVGLALQIVTGGEFLRHLITYNVNTWHSSEMVIWGKHVLLLHTPLIITAVCASLVLLLCKNNLGGSHRQLGIPVLYALLSWLHFPALGKAGSAENYLLEPLLGLTLLVGLAWSQAARAFSDSAFRTTRRYLTLALVAIPCFATILYIWTPMQRGIRFNPNRNVQLQDLQAASALRAQLRGTRGEVHSDLVAISLQAKKPMVYQPFIMSELTRQKVWVETPWIESIQSQQFELLVITEDSINRVYTEGTRKAILDNYTLEKTYHTPRWRYGTWVRKE